MNLHRWKAQWRGLGFAVVALVAIVGVSDVRSAVIDNGQLRVQVSDANGAIESVQFLGSEVFRLGAYISDFGFQNGTDTSTFAINNAYGTEQTLVDVIAGANVLVTGTFTAGLNDVVFDRLYSLVPGLNVLRIQTNFRNTGIGAAELSYFDTFDPDQGAPLGQGPGTYNDVFSLAGGTVGQARINGSGYQRTVIVGSLDSRATVASGNPFKISNGALLNDFFASPFDGNDAFADEGTHIGLRTTLLAGARTSFVVDIAFGDNPTEAQNAFIAASRHGSPVPEPSSMVVFGMGALLAFAATRRRRRVA